MIPGKQRSKGFTGQWAGRLIEMLESPAYRALSLSGHRVLARVEIELAHHGGQDNGRLPVAYDDFKAYGIPRMSAAAGIRECVALGFIEVTEPGRAGNAEYRRPTLFRLTYRPVGRAAATEEWQRIKTDEEAHAKAQHARAQKKEQAVALGRRSYAKRKQRQKYSPVTDFVNSQSRNRNRKPEVLGSEIITTSVGSETAINGMIGSRPLS